MSAIELLAPAGSHECLIAAVRTGADAVYLGGKSFNARSSAANFDAQGLDEAAKYCRARGVKVYLTLNTLVFEPELEEVAEIIRRACETGVDALIVQDLATAALARECAPSMPLHASTQMSVHSIDGVKQLEDLGFSRVVLARELSKAEITEISLGTNLCLECFVHGALCASVSGQCYYSAILGERSGNRGLCAQPCRLPMAYAGREYCLSLKDLSLVTKIPELIKAGAGSIKIEGRMKRPEYVAAAVTACRRVLDGENPDLSELEAVFSRDGFTSGYFDGSPGAGMLGTRGRKDVVAASPGLLSSIAQTYRSETKRVPVNLILTLKKGMRASLTAIDGDGGSVIVTGEMPGRAETSPTTPGKAREALSKTGGTPFYPAQIDLDIDEGLRLPASELNAIRREALEGLQKAREEVKPISFTQKPQIIEFEPHEPLLGRWFRIRIENARQLTRELADGARMLIIPADELDRIDKGLFREYKDKISVEIPRILFGEKNHVRLDGDLARARENGITGAVVGNTGSIGAAKRHGFEIHGDYFLNVTNSLSLSEYQRLGLCDATLSIELSRKQILRIGGRLPRGIIAYGYLPIMAVRSFPAESREPGGNLFLTDRRGNKVPVRSENGIAGVLNCVPLFIADSLAGFGGIDFFTLYFTIEPKQKCIEILRLYQTGGAADFSRTGGIYSRGVL